MNLFLQLSKPNVDIPEDSEVLGKFENWLHRILQMSWDDLLHEAVKLGGKLVAAVLIYIVGRWLIRKADGLLNRIFEKRGLDPSLNSFIRSILRIVVWVFLVMIIVGVLGIRTTSFLAILASAGFAVGMALSGTLQNFAGGVLILLLKPFRTGDYIVSQGVEGTVKAINLFNTVLITPDNKTIIIPKPSPATKPRSSSSRKRKEPDSPIISDTFPYENHGFIEASGFMTSFLNQVSILESYSAAYTTYKYLSKPIPVLLFLQGLERLVHLYQESCGLIKTLESKLKKAEVTISDQGMIAAAKTQHYEDKFKTMTQEHQATLKKATHEA